MMCRSAACSERLRFTIAHSVKVMSQNLRKHQVSAPSARHRSASRTHDETGAEALGQLQEGVEVLHDIGLGHMRSWVSEAPVLGVCWALRVS